MSIDGKALWSEVQENFRKMRECRRHRFEHQTVTLGMKINCLNCGGYLRLTDIGQYIAGYKAAGGDAADIWPAYRLSPTDGAEPAPPKVRTPK